MSSQTRETVTLSKDDAEWAYLRDNDGRRTNVKTLD